MGTGCSGGCAALGCKSEDWDEDLERKTTRKKIQTFIRLIRERYGSENCAKLRPQFFSKEERCFQTIRRVASILDEVYEME
ncbi:MAG: C_GCAxxG_C_C family protein [Clostridia bacterium]|nr:C_GCAxxG_C_C family protein [Clostridia bacterium]